MKMLTWLVRALVAVVLCNTVPPVCFAQSTTGVVTSSATSGGVTKSTIQWDSIPMKPPSGMKVLASFPQMSVTQRGVKPDTVTIQLPGRVDTLITQHTDTVRITVPAVHDTTHDTVTVTKTVVVHDTVQSAPPVVTPPKDTTPAQPAPTGAGILASATFDDGTFNGLDNSTPGHNSIIADPTSSGHGKVLQIAYGGSGPSADLNQYAAWLPTAGPSHGSTTLFRGDFYFPANTPRITDQNVLRKLTYWRTNIGNNRQADFVIFCWGNVCGTSITSPGIANDCNCKQTPSAKWYTFKVGAWNRLELQVTMNSKPGATDGTIAVWLNNVQVDQLTGVAFDAASDPVSTNWNWLTFGHQREGASGDAAINEVRYWDNIIFSTTRQP